ncbi:ABC transporter transmembrane domain-containing protein [Brevibacillus laterosporus]|uniref:ABC transporter transmembrane domain-containing protein n=1 Tax=Brevibacillus laterosporus TaxID=1465 RepID=UPI001EFF3BEB|nr:ABC transporter transmembrane domain-containing protein [Brevibacillus laterosporus]MED1909853.1 ABC transporter transmembrane domain-containing protein [Brevibacillus laterosporus]
MKTTAKVAGYGNIQVVSPYDIQTLQDLQLVKEANDHAKLYLTGIIPEEKKDSYIAMATNSDLIEVNEVALVMVTATMLILDWRFSLIFIVLGVGITFVNVRFVQPLRETNDQLQAKLGEITAKIAGSIEGLPIIKTFPAGKVVREDLADTNKELTQTANSQGFKTGLLDAINFLFRFVSLCLAVC